MSVRKALLLLVAATLALALSACGYSFRGKQNNLPADVRTIAIPILENRTGELRIEAIFTDEIIFQFTKSQMLRVTSEGQSDVVLKAYIRRVDIQDVALTRAVTSSQRRLWVTVSARLVRRSDGKVLWEDRALEQNRSFAVSGSIQATEIAKQQAYKDLAKDMAQTLHDRIFENF
jgi:outer membrane lipopolysaccharide assembly protein LptE/RlpB